MNNYTNILQEVHLTVLSNEECKKKRKQNNKQGVTSEKITARDMCLDKSNSRNSWIAGSACMGDTGKNLFA